jgi:ribosome-associated protein
VTSDDEKPSKTQRKKDVHALQALGEELVALNDEQLARIELPEPLHDAVMAARRITGFEAKRRQLQYIGKIMRRVEAEPIRAALDAAQARSRGEAAAHKSSEAWRERLLADPERSTSCLRNSRERMRAPCVRWCASRCANGPRAVPHARFGSFTRRCAA